MKHEGWGTAAAAVGVTLPPGADAQLDRYEALLIQRGAPMGIIAPGDVSRLRERHLLDCLRAAPLVTEGGAGYDLGSGGGLPGIVIAIVRPTVDLALVEVRRNRAAFLEMVVEDLGLAHVTVYPRRAETLRAKVGLCLARAFKPARAAWALAEPLLVPRGRLIYWAGETFDPDEDLPDGLTTELFRQPGLARSGPLAIMSRQ